MNKKSLFICASLIILSGCAEPTNFRDIRPTHWNWWGANQTDVNAAIERIKTANTGTKYWDDGKEFKPGNWTYEFSLLGDAWLRKGNSLETSANMAEAASAYYAASVYYGLAKYPYVRPTKAEQQAFSNHLATYRRSFELEGYGYQELQIPYKNKTIVGYLHLPKTGITPFPVVTGTNGIDVFAAESGPLVRDLLNRGIAVVMFDIAGTGRNRAIPLTPDFEQFHVAFLNALKNDPRIDTNRAGAFGMSYGGNAVVKLAMTQQQRYRAIANICGPVHRIFTTPADQVASVEPMYIDGMIDRMHLADSNPKTLVRAGREFSLIRQGLIGNGQMTNVPILSVNARDDYVAPESDMELVTNASRGGEILFSGENDHCPQDRFTAMPQIASFFQKHLQPGRRQ